MRKDTSKSVKGGRSDCFDASRNSRSSSIEIVRSTKNKLVRTRGQLAPISLCRTVYKESLGSQFSCQTPVSTENAYSAAKANEI